LLRCSATRQQTCAGSARDICGSCRGIQMLGFCQEQGLAVALVQFSSNVSAA
jgi:hypothetical protein